jgi:hypothetical protein
MARTVTARQLLVWLHVVTSVGWMSQAFALLALLAAAVSADGATALALARAADHLDGHVLVYFANASAFTGLVLAAATPWGLVRHWWVSAKFVATFVQLYLGIFVLHGVLHDLATAPDSGRTLAMAAVAGLMGGALAAQAWVSVAKPWGKTPLARGRGVTGPVWLFGLGVAAPVVDTAAGLWLGYPLPAVSLAALLVVAARTHSVRSKLATGQ